MTYFRSMLLQHPLFSADSNTRGWKTVLSSVPTLEMEFATFSFRTPALKQLLSQSTWCNLLTNANMCPLKDKNM